MKLVNFENLKAVYKKGIRRLFFCRRFFIVVFFFVFALISILTCFSRAQVLPFENKAKYEKMLEEKIDEVLIKILGPNQAKVVVDATLDFTRTEKFKVNANTASKNDLFKWQNVGGENVSSDYLLPGFPSMDSEISRDQSYDKQLLYPSTFVKKLDVTVMLNEKMEDKEIANIRIVVARLLMIDAKRGDSLSIVRASFAPLWRTIWYTPAAITMVLKYVVLTFMGIIAMIVVSIGFLRLAGAMSAMAKVQQSHQITMDLGKGANPAGGMDSGDLTALPKNIEGKHEEDASENESDANKANKQIVFNVRHDQVIFLVNMMIKEDPANVALIVTHLQPNIRAEFFRKLPSKFASEIMANMSKVRFIEPDTILVLKEEIEKRLSGAVGGVSKVIEALEGISLKSKKEMIEELRKNHPAIAAQVRKKVFLIEDLQLFSDKDLSLIISKIKVEEWAAAMWDILEPLKKKIREQMADKTWQMIEQSMSYGSPSPERINQSMEKIIETVFKLIKEGIISNPLENENQMITNDKGVEDVKNIVTSNQ